MTNRIFPYIFLGFTLLSASCSQEDVTGGANDRDGRRIEFRASMPGITTRATEVTTSNLNEFRVSAFKVVDGSEILYFKGEKFSRNSDTDNFVSSSPSCIWPNNGDLLRFVAFSPQATISESDDKHLELKVDRDITAHVDFLTAIAEGRLIDNEESGVSLKFQHQLSRIQLKAYGNSESYDLEIAGVRIGGIGTEGSFDLTAQEKDSGQSQEEQAGPEQAGVWTSVNKGYVEYIFRVGDKTVTIDGSEDSPVNAEKAAYILTAKTGEAAQPDNSAMIVPSVYTAWQYKETPANGDDHASGMYISMLVRVTDDTPYDKGKLLYPYADKEGVGERVYLAVDKTDMQTVKTRVYTKDGEAYFADAECNEPYDTAENDAEVKAYGWAALPVADTLKPGRIYTYTLNYTQGVGLRDPNDPNPGTPIISDRVLVNVEVAEWQKTDEDSSDVTVPRR